MRMHVFTLSLPAVLAMLAVRSLPAAVIACPTTATLSALEAFDTAADACFSQDKMFWGFTYTPGTGSVAPAATGVNATLIFQPGSGIDIHGWTFAANWSQASSGGGGGGGGGGALANFTLSYMISVCTDPACTANVAPGTLITQADATYSPSAVNPPGNEVVNWSTGASATLTSSSPGPLPPLGNINLGSGSLGPLQVTANFSGTGTISSTTLRFYETISTPGTTPEPASLALMMGGGGLFGLGCWRRRRKTK